MKGPKLPKHLLGELQGEKYSNWNESHNLGKRSSRQQSGKDNRQDKRGPQAPPVKRRRETEIVTRPKNGSKQAQRQPKKTSESLVPFENLHEQELRQKDKEEALYFAKKLGLKSLKLPKANDDLDDLLGDLDFDTFSSDSELANSDSSKPSENIDADLEFERSSENLDSEDENDGSHDEESQIENPWTDDSLSESDFLGSSGKSGIDSDSNSEVGSESHETTAKYVPVAKRKFTEKIDETLRRKIQGSLNKLAEANMSSIIHEIEMQYTSNPRALVSSTLSKAIIDSLATQVTLQENMLTVQAGLVTALYFTVGIELGAHFIQTLVEAFLVHYGKNETNPASNLILLLAECYSMGLVSPKLVYDLVRLFLSEVNEINTELLLIVVRNCGPQLRTDDPQSLKGIVVSLQTLVSQSDDLSVRTKFLAESVVALKNNRQKPVRENILDARRRVRKFLTGVKGASEPLNVSLDDIRHVDSRGKWWLVGAAWKGQNRATEEDDSTEIQELIGSAEPNWLELARKQRLNTDVRRAVFVALMGAEDYLDACQRIDRLRLKNKQSFDVPHVILHCCGNEKIYNPFYALVAAKQCDTHDLRKTMQFAMWDYLSALEKGESPSLQKTMHYARFYASIVAQGVLNLDLLKTLDFLSGNENIKVFIEVFLVYFYLAVGKQAERPSTNARDARALAQLVSHTKNKQILRGFQYSHSMVVKSSILSTAKQRDRVKWAADMMTGLIDELVGSL